MNSSKLPFPIPQIPVIALIPALLGGLVAAGYVGWFLFEVVTSSVGRGGYQYGLELPATPPVNVKEAPYCAQKTTKWVGCF